MQVMGAQGPREGVMAVKFKKTENVTVQVTSDRMQRHLARKVGDIAASTNDALSAIFIGADTQDRVLQLQEISERLSTQLYDQIGELADSPVELQAITGMVAINLATTFLERHEYLQFLLDIEGIDHEG